MGFITGFVLGIMLGFCITVIVMETSIFDSDYDDEE